MPLEWIFKEVKYYMQEKVLKSHTSDMSSTAKAVPDWVCMTSDIAKRDHTTYSRQGCCAKARNAQGGHYDPKYDGAAFQIVAK